MGRTIAVSVALVAIAIVIAFVILWLNRKDPVGDLNQKQEREMRQLLTEAAHVLAGLGTGATIDDSDVISDRSRRAINRWAQRYTDFQQKELNA